MKKFEEMLFETTYNEDTNMIEKGSIKTEVMVFGIVLFIVTCLALSFL